MMPGDRRRREAVTLHRTHVETEKAFMQAVIDLARLSGWRVYHPYDSRRSTPGYPDLTLCRGHDLLFAECKRQDGNLTPAQQAWLENLERCDRIETAVWRPSDWDAIASRLRA